MGGIPNLENLCGNTGRIRGRGNHVYNLRIGEKRLGIAETLKGKRPNLLNRVRAGESPFL